MTPRKALSISIMNILLIGFIMSCLIGIKHAIEVVVGVGL